MVNTNVMSSLIRLQLLWISSNYIVTFPGLRVFKIHLLKTCCGIVNTLILFIVFMLGCVQGVMDIYCLGRVIRGAECENKMHFLVCAKTRNRLNSLNFSKFTDIS